MSIYTHSVHTPHEPLQRVFVYGTLMTGERNAALTTHLPAHPTEQRDVGDLGSARVLRPKRQRAYVSGFCLYDLVPEDYPALIRNTNSADTVVWGELLRYDTYEAQEWLSVLSGLDDLEAVHALPPLYTRHRAQVHLPECVNSECTNSEQATLLAWIYIYARPKRLQQRGARLLVDGDWHNRTREGT